jgi:hypothetical protein
VTKGRVLSDKAVIAALNERFVPYRFNISDAGFPAELPALEPWKQYYEKSEKSHVGFFGHVVVGAGGKGAFGYAGSGHAWLFETSANYQADKYLAFLDAALDRYRRAQQIVAHQAISQDERDRRLDAIKNECLAQIKDASQSAPKPEGWKVHTPWGIR